VEDRACQFADAVYEVIALMSGKLIDADRHFDRLIRSLTELNIRPPLTHGAFSIILSEIVRRNRLTNGMVYIQVSRGVAPRYHGFPPASTPPGVIFTARHHDFEAATQRALHGLRGITLPDIRWGRPDIKTVCLLPNALAKQQALEAGAFEAIFVNKDGHVTEGSATNVWIVDKGGTLRTHPLTQAILGGVTRERLLEIALLEKILVQETAFTPNDLYQAQEAFTSGSVSSISPLVAVDNRPIGTGRVGPITTLLIQKYQKMTTGKEEINIP
jgi:D-alanine transaminase